MLIRSVIAAALWGLATCSFGEVLPPASERFASDTDEAPDFQRHVSPLLGRLGCNGRACHGSFQGQGGLRLSLFGYDFQMDYRALNAAGSAGGRRVDQQHPAASLILRKPTLAEEHEGGQRFAADSWQDRLLRRWIAAGAEPTRRPAVLQRLEVEPRELRFSDESAPLALRVIAVWENGEREDVTPLCRFRSNNDAVATVDEEGLVASVGPGDTHVVVFYDNGVAAAPVLRRFASPDAIAPEAPAPAPESIDAFILAKLRKLGLTPSPPCTDTEFLRRVSVDLTGTLPTPDEVVAFVADNSADKRERKIDELLQRPAYAAWWANKLCDFTGCNPAQQAELGQETAVQWYEWVRRRLAENTPYDELVRRIVLATGRQSGQSYDDYAEQVSAYFRPETGADFASRQTMPHYWTRRSMRKPEEAAEAFAHNFLGLRLQCAQCHKHPFAPWTQDDYREFSRFFESVKFGVRPEDLPRYRELAKQTGLNAGGDQGSPVTPQVLKQVERGRTAPWRELYIASREAPVEVGLLRSGRVALQGDDDPREPLMQWMASPDNPWFATALVNRVWAGYFHAGLIEPPDDLNPSNPPSHPELLASLSRGFIQQGFDMRWLHRTILNSNAYQRSWRPHAGNAEDRRNYSRAIPRRLPAEVVYDAVKQALAASDQSEEVRLDLTRRAIGELSMRLAGTYAMQVFGKPDRIANCDCERVNQPTLLQSIFLQNDPLVDQRLESSGWIAEVLQRQSAAARSGTAMDHGELVRQAWLRTLSRPPTAAEADRARRHLEQADSLGDGLRDLLWALLNTKEFLLLQ